IMYRGMSSLGKKYGRPEVLMRGQSTYMRILDQRCPVCDSTMRPKKHRQYHSIFLACEQYPACKGTRYIAPELLSDLLVDSDLTCLRCGRLLSIRSGRYGYFLACSDYPKCQHTRYT